MYTLKERRNAIENYMQNGDVIQTVRELGYPSIQTLRKWIDTLESYGNQNNNRCRN